MNSLESLCLPPEISAGLSPRSGAGADRARTVLVVEDEEDIRELVGLHLRRQGYRVVYAADGREGWRQALAERPALIVLDVMMPGLDGLSLLALVRKHPALRATHIVMLSARDSEEDVLRGLEGGAVDYVRKPFQVKELVARVRAVLRRCCEEAEGEIVEHPPLRIDVAGYRATLDGRPLALTAMEFSLLHALAAQPLRVLSRAQLLGPDADRDSAGRNVDVHIRSLRRKLSPYEGLIDTVRGVGYRFLPHGARAAA